MTDYSKYEGHTPGPWISNFASVRIIADAPALLARVKELEAELGCLKALFSSSKTK